MNFNKKEDKGITLISLVITIILLLILAGVTIAQLTGNGLFDKAKQAKQDTLNAQEDENLALASYEDEINEILNGTRNSDSNAQGINYSENETKTNNTWMGKPIYTKTIYISSLPNTTEGSYEHNIENAEIIWIDSSKSFIYNTVSDNYLTVPFAHYSKIGNQFSFNVTTSVINIVTGSDRSAFQAYITLEYTKTTD